MNLKQLITKSTNIFIILIICTILLSSIFSIFSQTTFINNFNIKTNQQLNLISISDMDDMFNFDNNSKPTTTTQPKETKIEEKEDSTLKQNIIENPVIVKEDTDINLYDYDTEIPFNKNNMGLKKTIINHEYYRGSKNINDPVYVKNILLIKNLYYALDKEKYNSPDFKPLQYIKNLEYLEISAIDSVYCNTTLDLSTLPTKLIAQLTGLSIKSISDDFKISNLNIPKINNLEYLKLYCVSNVTDLNLELLNKLVVYDISWHSSVEHKFTCDEILSANRIPNLKLLDLGNNSIFDDKSLKCISYLSEGIEQIETYMSTHELYGDFDFNEYLLSLNRVNSGNNSELGSKISKKYLYYYVRLYDNPFISSLILEDYVPNSTLIGYKSGTLFSRDLYNKYNSKLDNIVRVHESYLNKDKGIRINHLKKKSFDDVEELVFENFNLFALNLSDPFINDDSDKSFVVSIFGLNKFYLEYVPMFYFEKINDDVLIIDEVDPSKYKNYFNSNFEKYLFDNHRFYKSNPQYITELDGSLSIPFLLDRYYTGPIVLCVHKSIPYTSDFNLNYMTDDFDDIKNSGFTEKLNESYTMMYDSFLGFKYNKKYYRTPNYILREPNSDLSCVIYYVTPDNSSEELFPFTQIYSDI